MKQHPSIEFLTTLFPPDSTVGFINIRFLHKEKGRKKEDKLPSVFLKPSEIQKKLPPLLEKYRKWDVYFLPALVIKEGSATKKDIKLVIGLKYDLDAQPGPLPDNLRASAIWNTGGDGHRHGIFLLKTPVTPRDFSRFEDLEKRLCQAAKADPQACGVWHTLRLPGTLNHKYSPPREVKVIKMDPELRYDLDDFECLPPLEEEPKSPGDHRQGDDFDEETQRLCFDFFTEKIEEKGQIKGPDSKGRYEALCPLHKEKDPSFTFNVRWGVFKCFGCGEGGGIRDFSKLTGQPISEGLLAVIHPMKAPASSTAESEPVSELVKKIGKGKGYLHPAQDFKRGLLWYGVIADGQVLLVNSDKKILRLDELPSDLTLNNQGFNMSRFTGEGVSRFLSGDAVNGYDLLMRLRDFFHRYLIIRDERIFSLLATWTMATYACQVFQVFPYLSLRSPTRTCGKSRVLDLLRCVCFNATDKQTNPSEAVIYRHPIKNGGTLLLDEIETLHSQPDGKYGQIISTLNSGFQKGGSVTRYEKQGNKWVDVLYPTYCPRVLTGIKRLIDTLQSRSIIILMQRKLREERVDPLRAMKELGQRQPERDNLYIWALNHARLIEGVYEEAYRHPGLKPLEDRERDLWESLITIASICDNEKEKDGLSVSKELIGLAQDLSLVQADLDSGNVPQILKILEQGLGIEQQALITPADLFEQFKGDPYFEWLKSTKALAHQLAPLGLVSSHHRMFEAGKIKRAYKITRERLDDLKARYGVKEDE